MKKLIGVQHDAGTPMSIEKKWDGLFPTSCIPIRGSTEALPRHEINVVTD
jgi:hypothetical protein